MTSAPTFPRFDACFPELDRFVLSLVQAYEAGTIDSWDKLEESVTTYFTPDRLQQMEDRMPGWQKMASYSGGITLVHVMCVFLGLFMLPEYQDLSSEQKQLAKWIVLLHDIDKFHVRGKKDTMHAFRSGIQAGNLLPRFGFPTRQHFEERIVEWSQYTFWAFIPDGPNAVPRPDNRKLPAILIGIDNLFGQNTPAALIIKTVLLHISLDVDPFYPTPAPLTRDEIKQYITPELFPLLRVMMLSDNEGWSLFDPETRARQRKDTLRAFEEVEKLIS